MALVMWEKRRAHELEAHWSNYWLGRSTCKVMDGHEEEFEAFKKIPDLKFPPQLECRCMATHSSQRLHMGTQCSQCSDTHTQTKTRKSWRSVFFHINAKNLADDGWDQLFFLVCCRRLLCKWRVFDPVSSAGVIFFILWCRCWACHTFHGNWGPLKKIKKQQLWFVEWNCTII